MEGQGNFCRGCLIQYETSNELLQYTEKNRRQFFYSTGLQVKYNDAFTFQLCKMCYINMKTACKFRKQCRSSDKTLKNYLALREAGESMDFCTFLTNTDHTFRLSLMNGSSTPSHNKLKDDDNESTTTSIRNFMTDMMEAEDIPDMEASIIREVIAEEADILDDSLDSHWLRDDVSIDTDFNLDLSLSAFSPARSVHNDHCYSPLRELKPPEGFKSMPDLETITTTEIIASKKSIKETVPDTIDRNLEVAIRDERDEYPLDELIVSPAPAYSPALTPNLANVLFGENNVDNSKTFLKADIDLEMQNIETFAQGKDIGNYLALEENSQSRLSPKVGQCIETYENVQGEIEIFENSFQNDEQQPGSLKLNFYVDQDELIKENTEPNDLDKPTVISHAISKEMTELLNSDKSKGKYKCLYCEFTCKLYRELCKHTLKCHNVKFTKAKKEHLCTQCGMKYTDVSNYKRHLVRHKKNNIVNQNGYHCDICKRVFKGRSNIEVHMRTHMFMGAKKNDKDSKKKKFVCATCGSTHTSRGNYFTHMRRHNKDYTVHCSECGKGFCRKYDLELHMRSHTKLKPFKCNICGKDHSSAHTLQVHIQNKHTDERPHQCEYCSKRFVLKFNLMRHLETTKKCLRRRGYFEDQSRNGTKEAVKKINVTYKKGSNSDIDIEISKITQPNSKNEL